MSFEEKTFEQNMSLVVQKITICKHIILARKGHDYERFLKDAYIKTQYSKIIESNQFLKCPWKTISKL
jgi:hypothetical protein